MILLSCKICPLQYKKSWHANHKYTFLCTPLGTYLIINKFVALCQIWLNFMAIWFFRLFYSCQDFNFFFISNFFSLSITEETALVEMRNLCIKIGIVLLVVLHDIVFGWKSQALVSVNKFWQLYTKIIFIIFYLPIM